MDGLGQVGDREHAEDVEEDPVDIARAHALEDIARVAPHHVDKGDLGLGIALLDHGEFRRLLDVEADIHAHEHHPRRDQEGDAPAPGQELRIGQGQRQQRHHAGCQAQSDRQPDLRQRRIEAPFARRRVLIGHQHRAAPFAAQADALQHAQQQQQDRRQDADAVVGRHQSDQEGGHAHDHQRDHQHALAADLVAEVPEDHAAQRPRDKAHRKGGVGQHGGHQRVIAGEVQLVEDQAGDHAVQEEVIPLDGGADHGRQRDLADRLFVGACHACLLW
ncbi:hypothetical protein D9M72_415980 [compost metagenome]